MRHLTPLRRTLLLLSVLVVLLGGGYVLAQTSRMTLNDLWRFSILKCDNNQPCVNVITASNPVPYTGPQTLNDLWKGAFQICTTGGQQLPCLTITGGSGGTVLGNQGYTFTNVTTFTVTGATHGFGTRNFHWGIYDTNGNVIEPNTVAVNTATFDITITFNFPKSGLLVIG
jgi:hypothetical protein